MHNDKRRKCHQHLGTRMDEFSTREIRSTHKLHSISSNTKAFPIKIAIAIFAHFKLIELTSHSAGCKWLWINCWSSCKLILVKPFVKRWQLCLFAIYMRMNLQNQLHAHCIHIHSNIYTKFAYIYQVSTSSEMGKRRVYCSIDVI